MTNNQIIALLDTYADLLELHNENEFKIRSYRAGVFHLEKITQNISGLSLNELKALPSVGKSIAEKLNEINQNSSQNVIGSFLDLDNLLKITPIGLLDILKIKGIGTKKVRVLWQELNITTVEALFEACENDKVAEVKGFGEKTQETIKNGLLFMAFSSEKSLYIDAEKYALQLEKHIIDSGVCDMHSFAGQIRRKTEIVDTVVLLVCPPTPTYMQQMLDVCDFIEKNQQKCGVFVWRGIFKENKQLKIEVYFANQADFYSRLFLLTGTNEHLSHTTENGKTLLQIALNQTFVVEEDIFIKANLPYIAPELREGLFEFELTKKPAMPVLITEKDLKGSLHNHSTYSDGKNTLKEMADYCQSLGYQYLGITDHSKAAFYANGLTEKRVQEQHTEIDALNAQNPNFHIFKGIEADILNDGNVDYDVETLKTFDFVVASVHSNLKMNKEKATERLIKAIESPYTTILGHPTGRLLLRREGYPIDYHKVIDACAANKVAIEINAHPLRLDLDWRYVHYALEKGVFIAINPDAHDTLGFHKTQFGVHIARKGGLYKEKCLNALSKEEIKAFFQQKK